jgi:hypothetical protein
VEWEMPGSQVQLGTNAHLTYLALEGTLFIQITKSSNYHSHDAVGAEHPKLADNSTKMNQSKLRNAQFAHSLVAWKLNTTTKMVLTSSQGLKIQQISPYARTRVCDLL